MEFDMVGVDAAIANALRRILLAEVSVALLHEKCQLAGTVRIIIVPLLFGYKAHGFFKKNLSFGGK